VPLHRPRCWPRLKYDILRRVPHIYQFDDHGGEPRVDLARSIGRREVSDAYRACEAELGRHWDRVARSLDQAPRAISPSLARVLSDLPVELRSGNEAVARQSERKS